MSQFSSWIQRVRRSRALTVCGGGRVETREQRWSLKVTYEKGDVAEQALSPCYTAGSVTTECSPAPSPVSFCSTSQILFCFFQPHLFLCLCFRSVSFLLAYNVLSLSVSCSISFYSLHNCWVNLSFCQTLLCPSITDDENWGQWCTIKLCNLIPRWLLFLYVPCHISVSMYCIYDLGWRWVVIYGFRFLDVCFFSLGQ